MFLLIDRKTNNERLLLNIPVLFLKEDRRWHRDRRLDVGRRESSEEAAWEYFGVVDLDFAETRPHAAPD